MNSYTSVFKRPWLRIPALIAALLICLFLLDRALYLILAALADGFYGRSEVGVDGLGRTEFVRPGFYSTLIAGSSRAKEAVMPLYLYDHLGIKALNTASPGRYPRYHYHAYRRFREQNGVPALYIYGLDYFTFGKESNEQQLQGLLGGQKERKTWRIAAMNNPASPVWSRLSYVYRAKKDIDAFWIDLLDYCSFRFPLIEKRELTPGGVSRYKGLYGTVPRDSQLRPASWQKAAYDHLPGAEGEYFLKLLEELRRDRVLVILLVLPEYIAVYETNCEHEKQLAELDSLEKRFMNLFVLDYNDPRRFELDNPALFADGRWGERISHLSVFGAERLGQMLAADIPRLREELRRRRGE